MNMNELFNQYKEFNPTTKYNNDYLLFGTSGSIVFVVVGYLFFRQNFWLYFILCMSIGILFALVYNIYFYTSELKTILSKDEKENTFFDKILIYFNKIKRKRINNLRKLLKNANINTKEDIGLAINYYENRMPRIIKMNVLVLYVMLLISIVTMLAIEGMINYKLLDRFLDIILIIILPQTIILIIRSAHNCIIDLIKKERRECFIEDLYYIYYNSKIE